MAAVNKNMTIQELLEVDDGIADILMSSGMHCLGCIMASGEDLSQACAAHGIDSNALIDEINEYLKNK
jgi:hybrid cluster-associated redox disulfide protein